jgi:molybdate transport system ATP-binding protein
MRLNLQDEILKAHNLLSSVTLLVSHDLKEVEKLATSVLLLRNGNVTGCGKTQEMLKMI